MGTFSQTAFHNVSDRIAAKLQQDFDNLIEAGLTNTGSGLYALVDGTGDPEIEGALVNYANAFDKAPLWENAETLLIDLLGRTVYADIARQIESQVKTYGGYASLDAYCTGVSAVLHPLAAELFRRHLGESILSAANVFAPQYGVVSADRAYAGADGALVDVTTDLSDADVGDVNLFAADDHMLYLGLRAKPSRLALGLSTLASATMTPLFYYWNGSAWTALTVTDGSTGLSAHGILSWTVPTDIGRTNVDRAGNAFADTSPLYYIAIRRTADVLVTPPVATCARLVPAAAVNGSGLHLGVRQPPLAIGVITANDALTVTPIVGAEYTRFTSPAVRLRALNAFGAAATLTVSYTDQDGGAKTQAQAPWNPAALGTVGVTLNGADTGVRAVSSTGWVVSTVGGRGVFVVESVPVRSPAV